MIHNLYCALLNSQTNVAKLHKTKIKTTNVVVGIGMYIIIKRDSVFLTFIIPVLFEGVNY